MPCLFLIKHIQRNNVLVLGLQWVNFSTYFFHHWLINKSYSPWSCKIIELFLYWYNSKFAVFALYCSWSWFLEFLDKYFQCLFLVLLDVYILLHFLILFDIKLKKPDSSKLTYHDLGFSLFHKLIKWVEYRMTVWWNTLSLFENRIFLKVKIHVELWLVKSRFWPLAAITWCITSCQPQAPTLEKSWLQTQVCIGLCL